MNEETDNSKLTFAELFRNWREASCLSHEEIARTVGIHPRIVAAFEKGNHHAFPAYIYAAGYMKRIMDHYTIADSGQVFATLKAEWQEMRGNTYTLLPQSKRHVWFITPRRLLGVVSGAALLFFAWILITQLVGFTAAPRLRIDDPGIETLTDTPIITVRGSTERESQLTLNGREIIMNENGSFDQQIELMPGTNILRFVAQNRFGKSTEEIRYVVVK